MAFTQEDLQYDFNALEPHIDAKTMETHFTKHHAGYISKLNAALEKHEQYTEKSLEWLLENLSEVPEDIRTAVRNNGGGHYNHSFFWKIMSPDAAQANGEFLEAVNAKWGDMDSFKKEFSNAAASVFGSGWAWCSVDGEGNLKIHTTPNQDCPISEGLSPVLGIDVWEHAYYLNYQNRRPEYIKAWLEVACGNKVNENYLKAVSK